MAEHEYAREGCDLGIAWFIPTPIRGAVAYLRRDGVALADHDDAGSMKTFCGLRCIPWPAAWISLAVILAAPQVDAREFRVFRVPNGTVFSCQTCHVLSTGGPRNPFGLAVEAKIGSTPADVPFWDAALASVDSDGDGFSNGTELGDPDGDGTPIQGAQVTNPGNSASKPNSAPNFTSSPVTTAAIGTAYNYTATATDPDGHSITFSKVAGPSWLSVASNGAVSGTPAETDTGSFTVTIRATDNGSPNATRDQSYTLTVRATFAGWKNLHFTLPAENAIADAAADPDGDGLPNLFEYALRKNPRIADASPPPVPAFDGSDRLTVSVPVRDDAPGLSAGGDFTGVLPFSNPTQVNAVLSDPTPGDGFFTATFTDTVARFLRFRLTTTE
jgi:hypothetical protein